MARVSAQVAAGYRAHPAGAVAQYLLVEGLAGALLGVVLACALLRRAHGHTTTRAVGAVALGTVAVGTSLVQCVIGLFLTAAATGNDISRSGELSALVNRLDGVKMLALAGAAAWLAALRKPAPALPRWLQATAVPLALALIASGYAYLTASNAMAWTAYVSGPLLLLWVTGTGIALTASRREARRDRINR